MTGQPAPNTLPPLPVTVVSGYLGAGKTTLVNAMLAGRHGLRIAVLVNDFGSIAIDETLISGRDADVIALANGCMCCQVGGALYDAIDRILALRARFDHLVIETSGVADPGKIAQIAVAEPDLDLSRTVVLVDAANFTACLRDPRLEDTLLQQVRAADLIFLTRTKRVAAEALAELQMLLAAQAADAAMAPLEKGWADAWRVLAAGPRPECGPAVGPLGFHSLPFESWSWRGRTPVDRDRLIGFARDASLHAYRLKGRLNLTDGGSIVLHKVGPELAVEETGKAFDLSELVAIGARPEFDPALLNAAWARVAGTGQRQPARHRPSRT